MKKTPTQNVWRGENVRKKEEDGKTKRVNCHKKTVMVWFVHCVGNKQAKRGKKLVSTEGKKKDKKGGIVVRTSMGG